MKKDDLTLTVTTDELKQLYRASRFEDWEVGQKSETYYKGQRIIRVECHSNPSIKP